MLVENRSVDPGPPKARLILAVLAHSAGRVVPTQDLVRHVWGQDASSGAKNNLQAQISRIRVKLSEAGTRVLIPYRSGGYLLDVPEEAVDLLRVRGLDRRAHAHALRGEHREAACLADRALGQWSDAPLCELEGAWADSVRGECVRLCSVLLVRWAESSLVLGAAQRVCDRLTGHEPSDELTFAHMRAFVAEGRHADAIACYGRLRAHTVEELGTEPNPRTRALFERVLGEAETAGAPGPETFEAPGAPGTSGAGATGAGAASAGATGAGDTRTGEPPADPPPEPAPAPSRLGAAGPAAPGAVDTLRADIADFVGRDAEVRSLLDRVRRARGAPCVQLITGLGGTGKTTLAVHVAHEVREEFDLRLDVELGDTRVDAVLGRLLSMVGVPEGAAPGDRGARVALWRSRVAGRRVLLLLDNLVREEDLGLLVPGSPDCVVLATARRTTAAVGAGDTLKLGPLDEGDAVRLFSRMSGRDADEGVARIARFLQGLPIELRFGAAHLARHPTWSLDHLEERLHRQWRRSGSRTYTVFSDSLELLSPVERYTFLCAGLHPTATVTEDALAAAVGDREDVEESVDELLDTHFIDEAGPGRYRLHDHVRDFAEWYAGRNMTAGEREGVVRRYFDHYLTAVDVADRMARPGRRRMGEPLEPGPDTPVFDGARGAREWFAEVRPAVDALLVRAREAGEDAYVARLPLLMAGLLESLGPLDRAEEYLRWSCEAWERLGHDAGRADALYESGLVIRQQGDVTEADRLMRRAVDLWARSGAARHIAHARAVLAWLRHHRGEHEGAEADFKAVLNEFRRLGDLRGMAKVHHLLAAGEKNAGHHELAGINSLAAARIYRAVGDAQREASVLTLHAKILYNKGLYRDAEEMYERSRRVYQEHHDVAGVALAHLQLGFTTLYCRRYRTALDHFEAALRHFQVTGEAAKAVSSTAGLGAALLGTGRVEEARTTLESALEHTRRSDRTLPQARLLRTLGDVREAEGRLHEARWCYAAAVRAARDEGEATEEGRACERLGDLSDQNGAEKDALGYWRRAAGILDQVPNPYSAQVKLKIEMTLESMSDLGL